MDLAAPDLQVDAIGGDEGAKALLEAADIEQRLAHGPFSARDRGASKPTSP